MSKDINNFLKQFSIIGDLQNNSQFIGRKQMYDGTQFENFIMVPGSGKSTEGTLTITPIDNYTKLYQTNRDIWGFTASLRPKEQAGITLYLGVNFVPTSLLSEYNIAIGISDGPIDEVYKKVDLDLAAITTKYNDILLRGSYLTNSGQDVVMLHQGQNLGLVSNWGLFNPGGLFNMQIKTNLTAVDFNYSYGYIGTSDISSFTDPTITLTLIKKAQSVVEDKIYVTITETSQDPSSNDQQTGITTISNTPTNYSYVLVNPFPVLNNSGRRFRVTFTNPGNDLSNETMYIGITDQPTPLNFSTDSSFISYINSKRTLSSLTTLQTAEGFFYTGGMAELLFDSNKLTITKGLVSLDLTAYPSNHIMFGIRTNGLAIQPIQIFFEEVFPVVPPSDFTEAVDSFTNKYTMGASMWGVVNKSQQLSAGSAYSFAVNFDGSNLLSNYILAVGITEELVSEVITKANFPNQADALQRFNSLLEKGFFIVSDSITDPYEIRILEKGTQVSTHQSNLFISGAEGSFTLSVVNSVKLNYGSGETAYFPTTSNTLYLTFAYLKKEFAANVDSYLMTYSGSLIDVTNPMTNRYTAFPNSLGYKYNFAIPISRLRPSVDKLIITNTNSLSGSEFYCGVTKYNSTGILPFGLAETNFTNTYASTLRGNQTIDFNQVFSSGGTITISTSGNTVDFTNDVGVSTYGINNNNDTYYIFWGTTSSAQFNSITLRYEQDSPLQVLDSITNYITLDSGARGYIAQIGQPIPVTALEKTYHIGLSFNPQLALENYLIAVGVSEEPVNAVFSMSTSTLQQVQYAYGQLLLKGYFVINHSSGPRYVKKGVEFSGGAPFSFYNPGGLFWIRFTPNFLNIEFLEYGGIFGNNTIDNNTNLHLTVAFMRNDESILNESLYLSVSDDPLINYTINSPIANSTVFQILSCSYSFIALAKQLRVDLDWSYNITFENPDNNLVGKTFYIGTTTIVNYVAFQSPLEFDTFIANQSTYDSTSVFQTSYNAFYPGGSNSFTLYDDRDGITIKCGNSQALPLTTFPGSFNFLFIGMRNDDNSPISPIDFSVTRNPPVIPDLTTFVEDQIYKVVIENAANQTSKSCFAITDQNCEFNIEFPYISPNITKIRINFNSSAPSNTNSLYNGRECIAEDSTWSNTRIGSNVTVGTTNNGSAFNNVSGKWIATNKGFYVNFSPEFHKFATTKGADGLGETVLSRDTVIDNETKYLVISLESNSFSDGYNQRIHFKITNYNVIVPYSDNTLYSTGVVGTISVPGWAAMDNYVFYKSVSAPSTIGDYTFNQDLINRLSVVPTNMGTSSTNRIIWIGFVPNDANAITSGVYNNVALMQSTMSTNGFMGVKFDGGSLKLVDGMTEYNTNASGQTNVSIYCYFYNTNFYIGSSLGLVYKLRSDLARTNRYTMIAGIATINNSFPASSVVGNNTTFFKFNPVDTWSYLADNTLPVVGQEYTVNINDTFYSRREKLFPTNGLFEMELEITYIDPSITGIAFSLEASGSNQNNNITLAINQAYACLVGGQTSNMIVSNGTLRAFGTPNWLFTDKTLFITTSDILGGNTTSRQILFAKSRNSSSGVGNITKVISQDSTTADSNLFIAISRAANVGKIDLRFRLVSYSTRTYMPTTWSRYTNFSSNLISTTPNTMLISSSNQVKTILVGDAYGYGDYSFGGFGSYSLINSFTMTKGHFVANEIRYFGLIKSNGATLISTTYTSEVDYKAALTSNGFIGFRKDNSSVGLGTIINNGIEMTDTGLQSENTTNTAIWGFWIYGKKMFFGTRYASLGTMETAIQIADNIDRSARYSLIYGSASIITGSGNIFVYEAVNNFIPESPYLVSAQFTSIVANALYRLMIPETKTANYNSMFSGENLNNGNYIKEYVYTKVSNTNCNQTFIGLNSTGHQNSETLNQNGLRVLWSETGSTVTNFISGVQNFKLTGSAFDRLSFQLSYTGAGKSYAVIKLPTAVGSGRDSIVLKFEPTNIGFFSGATSLMSSVDPDLNNFAFNVSVTDQNTDIPLPAVNSTSTQGTYIDNKTLTASPVSHYGLVLGTADQWGFFDNGDNKTNSAFVDISTTITWTLYDNVTPNNLRVYFGLIHNTSTFMGGTYTNATQLEDALIANDFFGMSRQGPLETDFYIWDDYGKTQVESSMFNLVNGVNTRVWFGASTYNGGIWIGDGVDGGGAIKDVKAAYKLKNSVVAGSKSLIIAISRPFDNTATMPVTLSCQVLSSTISFKSSIFN